MKSDNTLGLRNIGPDIEHWLGRIGITSRAQFEKLGAQKIYVMLLDIGHEPDLKLLAILLGAEEDIDWQIIMEREGRFENSRLADIDEP